MGWATCWAIFITNSSGRTATRLRCHLGAEAGADEPVRQRNRHRSKALSASRVRPLSTG
jgi:hypothetical protein